MEKDTSVAFYKFMIRFRSWARVRTTVEQRWLLLIHQLPSKPAYFRVKIWRRLQGIGAVAVKSTVYALPSNTETQEDFEWLLKEIAEGGGEAMLCEARLIDGLSDAKARALFDGARDADYEAIAGEVRSSRKHSTPTAPRRNLRRRGPSLGGCANSSPKWRRSIFSGPADASWLRD